MFWPAVTIRKSAQQETRRCCHAFCVFEAPNDSRTVAKRAALSYQSWVPERKAKVHHGNHVPNVKAALLVQFDCTWALGSKVNLERHLQIQRMNFCLLDDFAVSMFTNGRDLKALLHHVAWILLSLGWKVWNLIATPITKKHVSNFVSPLQGLEWIHHHKYWWTKSLQRISAHDSVDIEDLQVTKALNNFCQKAGEVSDVCADSLYDSLGGRDKLENLGRRMKKMPPGHLLTTWTPTSWINLCSQNTLLVLLAAVLQHVLDNLKLHGKWSNCLNLARIKVFAVHMLESPASHSLANLQHSNIVPISILCQNCHIAKDLFKPWHCAFAAVQSPRP